MCVSIINERLEFIDETIVKTKKRLEQNATSISIYSTHSSTQTYLMFEDIREKFIKIWKLHIIVNEYFGLSILLITISSFITGGYTIYVTIIENPNNISLDNFVNPFRSISYILVAYIIMTKTCVKSNQIVEHPLSCVSFKAINHSFFSHPTGKQHLSTC